MCLEIRRVDHDRFVLRAIGGQAHHNPSEDAVVAPALPSVVKGLGRAVFLRRVAPAQPIVIEKDYAAEDKTIIDAGLAMAFGEERLEALHLGVAQLVKLLIDLVSLRSLNQAKSPKSMGLEPGP